MIYELRTYNVRTGKVPDYHKAFAEKIGWRIKYSRMAGHWYTEVGHLNQMVAIWPYENLEQRAELRQRAEAGPNPKWPPDSAELIVDMVSQIYQPAPFMRPLGAGSMGPLYEMRLYTYPAEAIPAVLEGWGNRIDEREKFSPLVGCWYSEGGGLDNFVHMWAYRSFDERLRVRAEARAAGVWPTPGMPPPDRQENKILVPFSFSPMQ